MQPRRWIILTAATALFGPAGFAATPASQPTTAPTTEPAAEVDAADEAMKQVNWPTIATAVKLTMKDRMLTMTTDLPALDEAARVKIADFPGKTIVVAKQDAPIITIRHDISIPPSTSI